MQMAALRANGYLHIPPAVEEIATGTEIDVRLMEPEEDVNRSLLISGSHDPALNYLTI